MFGGKLFTGDFRAVYILIRQVDRAAKIELSWF